MITGFVGKNLWERLIKRCERELFYISSESWEAAALAIAVKVSSTLVDVLALVSKYSSPP